MPYLNTASLRPSLLALAIFSALPGAAVAATDDMTVTATGNARSAFEAPMMVSVIDASAPENQTASSATDLLRHVPGLTLDGTGRTNGQDVNLRGLNGAPLPYLAAPKLETPEGLFDPSSGTRLSYAVRAERSAV